jgi:hypothetical protein
VVGRLVATITVVLLEPSGGLELSGGLLLGPTFAPVAVVVLAPGMGSNAAAALYASSVLFELSFSLMTIAIPF